MSDAARVFSRRGFIGGIGAVAGGVSLPRARPRIGVAAGVGPPGFPRDVPTYRQTYENWAREIAVDDLWTCAPRTADAVAAVVNWAAAHRYRVRPTGRRHGWSPLIVRNGESNSGLILVDTTRGLLGMAMAGADTVRVEAGVTMESLLAFLAAHGRALTSVPAPGDVTIGGVLAVGGHGAAAPARGEIRAPGQTFGSVSNLVVAVTAVVWDRGRSRYVVRRFERAEPEAAALLVHLGRAFVLAVELRTVRSTPLRCQSFVDIPAPELFGLRRSGGRTLASFVEASGRVEALWFPFTPNPWLKVWTETPVRPASARAVTTPYNYPFTDRIPVELSDLARRIVEGEPAVTPDYTEGQYAVTAGGLVAANAADLWGAPNNLQLYVRPSTIRETHHGHVVICRRADIQRVVNEFATFHAARLDAERSNGVYPVNMPTEIRVSGLDHATDVGIPGAGSAALSALRPRADHVERDAAVWIDVLSFPTTPGMQTYFRELEQWMYANFASYAHVRPEWSKGWAYDGATAWSDAMMIGRTIPDAYRFGQSRHNDFDWARAELHRLDPHGVFTNDLLGRLLG